MHPIDLSCHQKLEKKIHRPEAEILAHEVGNIWKKSRLTRSHLTHARSWARAQLGSHACETTGAPSGRILCEKEIFAFRSFYWLQEK